MLIGASDTNAQGYIDVAPSQGLDFLIPVQPMPFGSEVGTGVSFVDFDGDGWDDLTFANTNDSLIFYRNVEGSLQRLPSLFFGEGLVKQVLWVDFDNDGDLDLFVTTYEGSLRLLRNDGDWDFTDVSASCGFPPDEAKYYGASFGDYDRDGDLDLYVCVFIAFPAPLLPNRVNRLFNNNGDGTFTDVTFLAGVDNGQQASFRSVWMDVDLDGWPDLYVINDFLPGNALYRNNGDGTFTDMAEELGLLLPFEDSMCISVADVENDGDLDIFVSNTGIFPLVNSARSLLMLNNGDGTFTESSEAMGLNIFEWGWGGLWVDHNNDGFLDLYLATHREYGPAVANQFHINNGGTSFSNGAALFPSPQITESHAVARGDMDRDGYSDIVVQNQAPYPPYLWKNVGGTASFINVTLAGTVTNRQAVGTWIKVYAGGQRYVHYTLCGENYLGQSSQHIPFGLGEAEVVDSIHVEYLSGHVDRYYDLPVDTFYSFVEGDSYDVGITAFGATAFCTPDSVVLDAGEHPGYLWNTGDTTRTIATDTTGSFWVVVTTSAGLQVSSDTVHVEAFPAPVVLATVNAPACAEEASGSITLSNFAESELVSVEWETGQTGSSLNDLTAGVYPYIATDANGCVAQGTVELIDPDPLFALVQAQAEVEGGDGSLSWVIFGGTPPYVVELGGAEVPGSEVSGLSAGIYQVLVRDSLGCTYLETVEVQGAVSVDEWGQHGVELYPNPVDVGFWSKAPEPLRSCRVVDGSGRVVRHWGALPALTWMDVGSLAAGTYVLELHTVTDRRYKLRFTKQP